MISQRVEHRCPLVRPFCEHHHRQSGTQSQRRLCSFNTTRERERGKERQRKRKRTNKAAKRREDKSKIKKKINAAGRMMSSVERRFAARTEQKFLMCAPYRPTHLSLASFFDPTPTMHSLFLLHSYSERPITHKDKCAVLYSLLLLLATASSRHRRLPRIRTLLCCRWLAWGAVSRQRVRTG